MKVKHFLWISLIAGTALFNCSSSKNHSPHGSDVVKLPGIPTSTDSVEVSESDGLIGVEAEEESSKSYNVLDSILIAPN